VRRGHNYDDVAMCTATSFYLSETLRRMDYVIRKACHSIHVWIGVVKNRLEKRRTSTEEGGGKGGDATEVRTVRRDGESVSPCRRFWAVGGIIVDRHKREVGWATIRTQRWAPAWPSCRGATRVAAASGHDKRRWSRGRS
jgi:hypothetical protein